MNNDIRWKQRFNNFEKACHQAILQETVTFIAQEFFPLARRLREDLKDKV
ncbi:hypothetical protein LZ24_00622 [Desulfobotulus alkaliphilus]|uniref:Uncharacterized protein n=1 Tax=Desulfobotulus alkaliphilus TaxID=622671 RepID=A0A562S2K1_9BACT|nr:hypothetical protein [Desulfobotulus alkaliphilus]TWI75575.1 hypothetical protein LZ24_00622 [Desulfobotulus alkaliphilus]